MDKQRNSTDRVAGINACGDSLTESNKRSVRAAVAEAGIASEVDNNGQSASTNGFVYPFLEEE